MEVRITDRTKRVQNAKGEFVTVYQIMAVKDFEVAVWNGKSKRFKLKKIKMGEYGGFVELGVVIGSKAWIHKNTIIFGKSRFYGVSCGYARIEDSIIHRGTIVSGRAIIRKSSIGHDVIISGTTSIFYSEVKDNSTIIGTILRYSKVESNLALKCAGVIENKRVVKAEHE